LEAMLQSLYREIGVPYRIKKHLGASVKYAYDQDPQRMYSYLKRAEELSIEVGREFPPEIWDSTELLYAYATNPEALFYDFGPGGQFDQEWYIRMPEEPILFGPDASVDFTALWANLN
jgi:hypothetical protein